MAPRQPFRHRIVALALAIVALITAIPGTASARLPSEDGPRPRIRTNTSGHSLPGAPTASDAVSHELAAFAASLAGSDPDQLQGVFVPDVFSLQIVGQPDDSPSFISPHPELVTQFSAASNYGSIGLLAHNYLAGAQFSQLEQGEHLYLVYGADVTQAFVVTEILEFQALQPDSPYSDFVDLESDAQLSASDLFTRIYRRDGAVILQTCIEANGDDSWGRLFVVAEPV